MKVKIDKDEWFPIYSIVGGDYGDNIELTEEEYFFIQKVGKDFDKVQDILRKKYKEAGHV